MYNFIDVNGIQPGNVLPGEALKINGVYIENKITGYRTLSVSGREALSPELQTYETGARDGSTLQSKRFPARVITVQFGLISTSNSAFRAAFNRLGEILNVENAELIFADEPDKFFVGTPSGVSDIEPGRNAVIGEFTLYCADPFKYSVTEYAVAASARGSGVSFVYNGTYKAYPKLEAAFWEESEPAPLTGNGECGFVSFFDQNENIVQLGDPEEVDSTVVYPKSDALLNQIFKTSDAWNTAARDLWSLNSGPFDFLQIGTLGMRSLHDGVNYYLAATSYGAHDWECHGASITRTIPADPSGNTTNTLFELRFKPVFAANSIQTYGEFSLILITASGDKPIKMRLVKNTAGREATMMFYVGTDVVYEKNLDVFLGSPHFGSGLNNPNCIISQTDQGVLFNIGGVSYLHRRSEPFNIAKFAFMFSQYGKKTPLAYNGLLWCQFIKNHSPIYVNIPNKFKSNDVVVADCRDGRVTLNNTPTPQLGALGNDWEKFCLQPGLNQIGMAYSDWAIQPPLLTVRYREVFL